MMVKVKMAVKPGAQRGILRSDETKISASPSPKLASDSLGSGARVQLDIRPLVFQASGAISPNITHAWCLGLLFSLSCFAPTFTLTSISASSLLGSSDLSFS